MNDDQKRLGAFYFQSTDEYFVAESRDEAVQMWLAGERLIALDTDEPREVFDETSLGYVALGEKGITDR